MAHRPVFVSINTAPFYKVVEPEFKYYYGFSLSQNRKTISSLHEAFSSLCPELKILEISSKSANDLGVKLSAFNLKTTNQDGFESSVECFYQGGKIFENGGPYYDLINRTSREAKKDPRIYESGDITGFYLDGKTYTQKNVEPFYSWLYINALRNDRHLSEEVEKYDAFTDIVYSPRQKIDTACQARSAAIYVGLKRAGLLDEYVSDIDTFLDKHFAEI